MDDQKQQQDMDARRRRLDALFADEPFLSPTMKARRLYEKIEEQKDQECSAPKTNRLNVVEEAGSHGIPPHMESPRSKSLDTMNFADASACLRRGDRFALGGRAHQERLRRFRDEILRKWLEFAPKRDRDS